MLRFRVASCGCVQDSFLSFQTKPFECYSPPLLSRGYSQHSGMGSTICATMKTVNGTGVLLEEGSAPRVSDRLPLGLFVFSALTLLSAAGRRNNVIRAQVFHHLPIVIKGMGLRQNGHLQPGQWRLAPRTLDWRHQILLGQAIHGFVQVGKRVLQILDDLILRLQAVGSIFLRTHFDGILFAQNYGAKLVVGRRNVADLKSESADSCEFSIRGSKSVFIG